MTKPALRRVLRALTTAQTAVWILSSSSRVRTASAVEEAGPPSPPPPGRATGAWSEWSPCRPSRCAPCDYGPSTTSPSDPTASGSPVAGDGRPGPPPPLRMTPDETVASRGRAIRSAMESKAAKTLARRGASGRRSRGRRVRADATETAPYATAEGVPCVAGRAGPFPCRDVDLEWWRPAEEIGGGASETLDHWGWTSPETGAEYALVEHDRGTAFLRAEDGTVVGHLPSALPGKRSFTRDVKVLGRHAFVVSDPLPFDFDHDHGMQVFDLARLDGVDRGEAVAFNATARYRGFGNAHNLISSPERGRVYAVGSDTCRGGMHAVDVRDPKNPQFAGCAWEKEYVHDAQCVIYRGPDSEYLGEEVCFLFSVEEMRIVKITTETDIENDGGGEKATASEIGTMKHDGVYAHQGWTNCEMDLLFMDDELDEQGRGADATRTKTYVINITSLSDPRIHFVHYSTGGAIDHNQYVCGAFAYQANYRAGLRIMDASRARDDRSFAEHAFFDTFPPYGDRGLSLSENGDENDGGFDGAWNVFPFYDSGKVLVNSISGGVGVVSPRLKSQTRTRQILTNVTGDVVYPHLTEERACAPPSPPKPLTSASDLTVFEGWWGSWKSWKGYLFDDDDPYSPTSPSSQKFACGAEMRYEDDASTPLNDITAANGLRIAFCSKHDEGQPTDAATVVTIHDGAWGEWKGMRMCPPGRFVRGAQVKAQRERYGFAGDDYGIAGLRLWCAEPQTGMAEAIEVYSGDGDGKAEWRSWVFAQGDGDGGTSGGNEFVVMARVRFQDPVGFWRDDTALNGLQFKLAPFQ